jgi:hypothetical protein
MRTGNRECVAAAAEADLESLEAAKDDLAGHSQARQLCSRKRAVVGKRVAGVVNIERVGATYRVNANMGATIDPAAGATMASARIIPSIQGRQNPNFESGIQSTY